MEKTNNNYMTKEEMNDFLESIGGLESGYRTNWPPIKSAGFFAVGPGWYGFGKTWRKQTIIT
jgi:hypothetical protein